MLEPTCLNCAGLEHWCGNSVAGIQTDDHTACTREMILNQRRPSYKADGHGVLGRKRRFLGRAIALDADLIDRDKLAAVHSRARRDALDSFPMALRAQVFRPEGP